VSHHACCGSRECFSEDHRRFTLAHELGHFVLDGHVEVLLGSESQAVSLGGNFRDQRTPTELEADVFASELLMPDGWVAPLVGPTTSLYGIRTLASTCRTSLSSAAIRMMDLAEEPAAVILSFEGTVEWFACSPLLSEHRWARRSLKGEWVPRRSPTKELIQDPALRNEEAEREGSLLLCEWFPDGPPMCRVEETCLTMGSYGRVLTLLRPEDLASAEEIEEVGQHQHDREREADWRGALRDWDWDWD
jgi:hypothetical protein